MNYKEWSRRITVKGNKLEITISPCCWMHKNYPLQLSVKGEGYSSIHVIESGITLDKAVMEDVEKLAEAVTLELDNYLIEAAIRTFNNVIFMKWLKNGHIELITDKSIIHASLKPVKPKIWRYKKGKNAWDECYWDITDEEVEYLNTIEWE